MAKLKNMARPKRQRKDYLFFKNEDTGTEFKALHELREGDQPVMVISISPVGGDGKARTRRNGNPDVSYHSHTFTEHEIRAEGFEFAKRVREILPAMVDLHEREILARQNIETIDEPERFGSIDLTGGV